MKQQATEHKYKTLSDKIKIKENIIKDCTLAALIKEIFESFYFSRSKTLRINNWI